MSDRGRIRWWKSGALEGPGSAASPTTIGRPGSIVEAETSDAWRELARRFDLLPTTVDASSPKDDAVGLLRLAAEVEHALMVQYLYAAVSLTDDPGPRQKLLVVAIQEMYHLLSVQNLLIALDGPAGIYLGRDHLRLSSAFNPLPLDFEPVGELALAKFVVVEAPEAFGGDATLRARVQSLEARVEAELGLDPRRVGVIYATLDTLFQPGGSPRQWHLRPEDFADDALIRAHAADRGAWGATSASRLLEPVTNPADGRALLGAIADQGEGLGDARDSHFLEFLELLDAWAEGTLEVRPLPLTPFAGRPPPRDARLSTRIEHPYAALWADVFDLRYELLLLDIWRALATPRGDARRTALVELVFKEMPRVVRDLAAHLTTLDLRPDTGSSPAAPPYGLQPDEFPPPDGDPRGRTLVLLGRQRELLAGLMAAPEFVDDFVGQDLADEIDRVDRVRPL